MTTDSFRNRTAEFTAIIDCLQKQSSTNNLPSSKQGGSAPLLQAKAALDQHRASRGQFSILASGLGNEIQRTSEKLYKLTQLVKSTSLFNEQTVAPQVSRLISDVNKDIQGMSQQLDGLKHEAEMIKGGSSDSSSASSASSSAKSQPGEHACTVVSYLKLRLGETTSQFRDVLQLRTETLQAQHEKKQRLSGMSSLAPLIRTNNSPLYNQSLLGRSSSSSEEADKSEDGEVSITIPQVAMTQQDRYYSSRADAVKQIETNMQQLQGIFAQLANLVADQGEMLQRIDTNVDSAVADASRAHDTLMKNLHKISQNRWLILKVFSVLIVTVILFVVFFL